MIGLLIEKAIRQRWLVLIFAIGLFALGAYAFARLPIDAYPDIASQTVWVITPYTGRAPEEVERRVT